MLNTKGSPRPPPAGPWWAVTFRQLLTFSAGGLQPLRFLDSATRRRFDFTLCPGTNLIYVLPPPLPGSRTNCLPVKKTPFGNLSGPPRQHSPDRSAGNPAPLGSMLPATMASGLPACEECNPSARRPPTPAAAAKTPQPTRPGLPAKLPAPARPPRGL